MGPEGTDAEVTVQKAVAGDLPAIMRLLEQANMHRIPSAEMPALTFDNYWVARRGDEVLGFCGYKVLSATDAKTELMVVDESARGLGVGLLLQAKRMDEMLARGLRTVTTNADRPATIAWYKKHFGYREVGRLAKLHEFGDPHIGEWTTLQADLTEWARRRSANTP